MRVIPRDGESFEGMLKRFRSGVEREGVLREAKRRQRFMSKSEENRLRERRAIRRMRSRAKR